MTTLIQKESALGQRKAGKHEALDKILIRGIKSLDLTKEQHEKAVQEYKALASCLRGNPSFWKKYQPDVYLQGSMDLGTCVRPIGRDEFDLDVVVVLNVANLTILETMNELGLALREFQGQYSRIERKERCFRLHYPGDFHIDVVPAHPNPNENNLSAIRLPDCKAVRWTDSDPQSFKVFFGEAKLRVLMPVLCDDRMEMANMSSVAPPPNRTTNENKTILQHVVQILKRHRDIFFQDRDDMTSSAIITSLAAQAYEGHQSLFEALQSVASRLALFVSPVEPRVANPNYFLEDYADRWVKMPPDREAAFKEWHRALLTTIEGLSQFKLHNAELTLNPVLGKNVANEAIRDFDEEGVSSLRRNGKIGIQSGASLLALSGQTQAAPKAEKTTFFGD